MASDNVKMWPTFSKGGSSSLSGGSVSVVGGGKGASSGSVTSGSYGKGASAPVSGGSVSVVGGGKGASSGSVTSGSYGKGASAPVSGGGGSVSGGGKGASVPVSGSGGVSVGGGKGASSGSGVSVGGGKGQLAGEGASGGGRKGQSFTSLSSAVSSLEKLRTALDNGAGHISATNKIGVSSGVTQNGRELTAREAQWQLDRARTTSDRLGRQARTAMRKAATADNPYKSGAYTMQANAALRGQGDADDRADALGEQMAGSVLENLTRPARVAVGGGGPKGNDLKGAGNPNDPNALLAQLDQSLSGDKPILPPGPLSDQAREIMSSVRGALAQAKAGGAGSPSGQSGDLFSQFMDALSPKPTQPVVQPTAPQIAMTTVGGGREMPTYDYNGVSVELGGGIDMNDADAVNGAMAFNNQIVDWMNDDSDNDWMV